MLSIMRMKRIMKLLKKLITSRISSQITSQKTKLKTRYKTSSPGITLVELLIYMGLFTGFLVILSGVFVSTLEVQSESSQTARIEQDSQYLFARLQYDVSRADDLISPAVNGETTNSLVIAVTEGELTYFIENGQLKLSLSGGTSEVITSTGITVSLLEFQRLANEDGIPSVRTQIQLNSTALGSFSPETRDLTYTLGLR
jgi:hypothetical protein